MKRKLSVLIVLVMMLLVALPVLASCNDPKVVTSIKVVDPQTEYTVGDTIDYDNLKIKVTYNDGTTETKTVAALKATVVVKADLSKAKDTFYTISYKGQTDRVDIKVKAKDVDITDLIVQSFTGPEFYTEYKEKSADRAAGSTEQKGDFRVTGEMYEVGNANKFIYRPSITALDVAQNKVISVENAKTTAKVFVKNATEYTELTGANLTDFVTIDDNTYKFSEDAAGKQVKLEISVDEEAYDVEDFSQAQRTLVVEFVVVDGGYNVYDQTGLSVMADLEKRAWSEIWKCDVVVEGNQVKCVATKDSITLEADDKPLCEYVDKISTVIIHNNITLDPDNMPSLYFWTDAKDHPDVITSDLWDETYASLSSFPEAQKQLAGSLRSGANNGISDRSYMRVIDTDASTETSGGSYPIYGGHSIELNIGLNMQRALFATKKVNISGNYNSIETPERGKRSEGGRILEIYADYLKDGTGPFDHKVTDPYSHWSVFQMKQSKIVGSDVQSFTMKNIAFSGNNPQVDDKSTGVKSAGLMLSNNYAAEMTIYNVNADRFFTVFTGDNHGDLHVNEGKIAEDDKNNTNNVVLAQLDIVGSKMYDAYSNMVYLWRYHVAVENCEMIGSGGPLFILCDGSHTFGDSNDTDAGSTTFDVDDASVFQAYATGIESWYESNNVQMLFTAINQQIVPVVNALGKTIHFSNPTNQSDTNKYINVIAAIICEPEDVVDGGEASNVNDMRDIRGVFTQKSGEQVLNKFEMHHEFLQQVRGNAILKGSYAAEFAPIIHSGNNIVAITGSVDLGGGNVIPTLMRYPISDNSDKDLENLLAEQAAWADNNSNLLCIYMSAGVLDNMSPYAPYFGIIVQMDTLAVQQ